MFGVEPVQRGGTVYVAPQLGDAEVGGEVKRNVYGAPPDPEPDEVSVIDGYDIAWEVRRVPPGGDNRREAAGQLFDEIVARLRWPVLIVENLSALVAAWNPSADRTDFPAGTSPDADDQELWCGYAITA